ncbi:flagellar motor protein MotB [Methylobacterium sp. JK268]
MSVRAIGWLAGLPVLIALGAGAAGLAEARLDAVLSRPAAAVAAASLGETAEPWLTVERWGRDLVASGDAPTGPERDAARDRLGEIPGLRHLVDRIGTVSQHSPFVLTVERRDGPGLALSGDRPAEMRRDTLEAQVAAGLGPDATLRDEAHAARGAPPGVAAAAAFLAAQAARLAPGGTATLRDRTLSLRGEAASVADHEALRAALAAPPEGFTLGAIAVAPALVHPFAWSATRRADGGIRLDGYAVSEADRAAMRAAARALAEGAPVEDFLRIARGLPARLDPRGLITRAFAALALLREGTVALDGAALTVRGAAIDAQAVREADVLTTGSLSDGLVPGRAELTASPVSPYRVAIRREPATVTLTGHLPDAETRAALLAALRPLLFGERIVDRTRLADGAPDGLLAALRAAVPPLAQLARGEVAVSDRDLRLSGESLYPESARRLTAAAPGLAPPGWHAFGEVRAKDAPPLLDAAACRAAFAERTAGREVRFAPGSAALQPGFYPALDDLASLARLCPEVRIEVAGHDDPPAAAARPAGEAVKDAAKDTAKDTAKPKDAGKDAAKPAPGGPAAKGPAAAKAAKDERPPDPPEPDLPLPQRRAAAIVDYLLKAGVPAERVAAVPGEAARRAVAFALRS